MSHLSVIKKVAKKTKETKGVVCIFVLGPSIKKKGRKNRYMRKYTVKRNSDMLKLRYI